MYPVDLSGKNGIVFGVANHRSIAWAIARILNQAGARMAIAYQNERVRDGVAKLAEELDGDSPLIECDVSNDDNVQVTFDKVGEAMGGLDIIVHSIAFADRNDL
ncbi:MAG: SDR family oxidoreductase, partial [Chloroflexi bacterium]|nr:SDR family oxidoreductase [Chloroflexota bacterium]